MAPLLSWQKQKPAIWAALERCLRGAQASGKSVTISFVKCSTRLSDYAGLVGSQEALLDRIRDCGLIPDDDFKTIGKPNYDQIKVATRKECGTFIRIELPD